MFYYLTSFGYAKELYFYDSSAIAPISTIFVDAQSELFPSMSLWEEISKYEVGIRKREHDVASDNPDNAYYQQFMEEKKVCYKKYNSKHSEDTQWLW